MERLAEADGLSWLTLRPIAHRGLHDMADANPRKPENTLAAIQAAVENDYAIECDLQISADGVPVVFHDDMLDRLTGETGPVRGRTAAELARIEVLNSGETIPRLSVMLEQVAGAVPLVIELKSIAGKNGGFAQAVADDLRNYAGPVAVMSFDTVLAAEVMAAAPGLPVGLVAEGGLSGLIRHLAAIIRHGFHFVSYSLTDLPTAAPLIARWLLGLPLICWTARTPAGARKAKRWTDQMTFEGIRP
ncbi:MAG TPA: glycerophosphodiester phosphodiesterase family protein [Afifellaceae bacterium]|nr:glycerophosphodiester phosphodiesterase family protein [Afifellaceae bacterium]